MVFEFHDTSARKFKARRLSTGKEPVPRRPAALCASALVPVSVLKRIGTKTDWCVVDKRRARNLLSTGGPEGGELGRMRKRIQSSGLTLSVKNVVEKVIDPSGSIFLLGLASSARSAWRRLWLTSAWRR